MNHKILLLNWTSEQLKQLEAIIDDINVNWMYAPKEEEKEE